MVRGVGGGGGGGGVSDYSRGAIIFYISIIKRQLTEGWLLFEEIQ